VPQQPDHLDVAVRLGLEPPARAYAVQIAVDVELEQIGWRVTRAARCLRLDPDEPGSCKVQPIDERVDEAHRVVRGDIIIDGFWQQQRLGTVMTRDMRHAGFYRVMHRVGIRSDLVFTRSAGLTVQHDHP
jgi:hypothetical protein